MMHVSQSNLKIAIDFYNDLGLNDLGLIVDYLVDDKFIFF